MEREEVESSKLTELGRWSVDEKVRRRLATIGVEDVSIRAERTAHTSVERGARLRRRPRGSGGGLMAGRFRQTPDLRRLCPAGHGGRPTYVDVGPAIASRGGGRSATVARPSTASRERGR
ncbi:proline-rich receptor-like protein kinase PERK9 [Iris pallida]|uniref:Proline-rich receptor-like protein kinase PERK9 n=1 Tax=Iris pallida TaxID=29817 RepID=A0AAX6HNU6_IRIPA|nr:proline-rich receptor-like protein kinase PERK9 [Iris pallida]